MDLQKVVKHVGRGGTSFEGGQDFFQKQPICGSAIPSTSQSKLTQPDIQVLARQSNCKEIGQCSAGKLVGPK